MEERRKWDLEKTKEEVRALLPKVYSRAFNASLKGEPKFDLKPLKITPTKSLVFELSGVKGEMEDYSPQVPLKIIVKKYIDKVERASEDSLRSTEEEAIRENTILFNNGLLSINSNLMRVEVYPKSYSTGVEECYKMGYLFREFIGGKTLNVIAAEELTSDLSSQVELSDKLKSPLYPIALSHLMGENLKMLVPSYIPKKKTTEELLERFVHYLWKISKKKLSRNEIRDKIKNPFIVLAENYFTKEKFNVVINGDLDVYPHHILITGDPAPTSRLIDAGSIEEGALFRDLVVYSDPVFKKLENVEHLVSNEYIIIRNKLEELLHFEKSKFNVDEIVAGFCAAAWYGNIRRAASLINYGKEAEYKNAEAFKEEVSKHIHRSYHFLDNLIDNSSKEVQKAIKKLANIFCDWGLFDDFLIDVPSYIAAKQNNGNGNGSKAKEKA